MEHTFQTLCWVPRTFFEASLAHLARTTVMPLLLLGPEVTTHSFN